MRTQYMLLGKHYLVTPPTKWYYPLHTLLWWVLVLLPVLILLVLLFDTSVTTSSTRTGSINSTCLWGHRDHTIGVEDQEHGAYLCIHTSLSFSLIVSFSNTIYSSQLWVESLLRHVLLISAAVTIHSPDIICGTYICDLLTVMHRCP